MKVIYKYKLGINGESVVIGAKVLRVLHVEAQNGWPTLWALVERDGQGECIIDCYGTGWELNDDAGEYLGSCIDGCGFVWHYWKREDGE